MLDVAETKVVLATTVLPVPTSSGPALAIGLVPGVVYSAKDAPSSTTSPSMAPLTEKLAELSSAVAVPS